MFLNKDIFRPYFLLKERYLAHLTNFMWRSFPVLRDIL